MGFDTYPALSGRQAKSARIPVRSAGRGLFFVSCGRNPFRLALKHAFAVGVSAIGIIAGDPPIPFRSFRSLTNYGLISVVAADMRAANAASLVYAASVVPIVCGLIDQWI